MKLYNFADDELIEPKSISDFEDFVRRMEADEKPLAYTIEVDGGTGSTLLNVLLPDFTDKETLALLQIFETASERTIQECEDSIKLCNRKLADLQGLKVIQCGNGGCQA